MAKYRPFSCIICGMYFHSRDRRRSHVARHLSKYSCHKLNLRHLQRITNGVGGHVIRLRRKKSRVVKRMAARKGYQQQMSAADPSYNSLPHLQPLHHISALAMPNKFHPPHISKSLYNAAAANPFNRVAAGQMNGMIMPRYRFLPPFMVKGQGFPLGFGNYRPMGIATPYPAFVNGFDQSALKGNLPLLHHYPPGLTNLVKQGSSTGHVNGHNSQEQNLDTPLDLSNKGKEKEIEVEVDTITVAARLTNELKRYGIPQAVFARVVLGRTQGTLSDLLRNPKPWSKLKSGRETFRRMAQWLEQPEVHRMSALRLATKTSQNQEEINDMINQIPLPGNQPLDLDVKTSDLSNLAVTDAHQIDQVEVFRSLSPKRKATTKKPRLVFTQFQKSTLHEIFKNNKRPSKELQQTAADHLGLELSTVNNFFMNARRRSTEKWQEDGDDPQPSSPELNASQSSTPPIREMPKRDEEVLVKCEFCHKCFRRQRNLTKHLRHHHKRVEQVPCKIVQCEICLKVFSCNSNLTRHLQVHSRESREMRPPGHICQYCLQPFGDERTLAIHVKTHKVPVRIKTHKAPVHQCNYCDKSYTRSNSLNRHILNVHRNLFVGHANMP